MIARRLFLFGLVALPSAVLVLAAAAWWIVASESGTSWLIGRVAASSPSILSIGGSEGSLVQDFSVDEIALQIGEDEVYVERAQSRLNIAAILRGVIDLEELTISDVVYRRGIATPVPDNTSGAAFPMGVRIQRGTLQGVQVISDDNEFVIGPTSFGLAVDGDRATFSNVSTAVERIELQASGELRLGTEIDLSINLDWGTNYNGLRYEGGGTVNGVLPILQLNQELRSPAEFELTGELVVNETPSADIRLSWLELDWPGLDMMSSPDGEIHLSGWQDSYDFDATGQIVYDAIPADFSIEGSGNPSEVAIEALSLTTERGNVNADGQVEIGSLAWVLNLDVQDLDPGSWLPEWQGDVQGSGLLRGQAEPLEWSLTDTNVSGTLRDQPVSAQGSVSFQSPNIWQLDDLGVLVSGNQINLDGTLGGDINVDVFVDAPDIHLLLPDVSGNIVIDGRVAGTLAAPELSGRLNALALRYGSQSAETLVVEGEAVLVDDAPVDLELHAEHLVWRDVEAQSLTGSISGTSDEHALVLDVESDIGTGQILADGRWTEGSWSGIVNSLSLSQPSLGDWALTNPTEISVGRDAFELQSICLQQLLSEVCGSTRLGTDDDFVQMSIAQFDLRSVQAFLPDDVRASGLLDGQMSINAPLADAEGTISLSGTSILVQAREGDAQPLDIPIESLDLEAQLAPEQLDVELELLGARDAQITLDARILGIRGDDPEIIANVNGAWPDLAMLSVLSPDVNDVSGTASLDLIISGPVSAPQLQGEAQWVDGGLTASRWGLLIEDIEASASSPDGSIVEFVANGISGDGPLNLTGTTDLSAESWPTRLTIQGDTLQAVRTSDAEVFVSPQLEVDVALPDITVTGSVLIPRAQVVLDEVPTQAVSPSADSIVHGELNQLPPRPINVHADLEIILGEDVSYSGAGLDVDLAGELGLAYDSGRNAIATGSVTLLGDYEAYGQTLNLERGELLFAGPLDNPGLDVRAVRTIEPITVGVQLAGTVKAPTTQIFSSPAMSEADALSYLLFGRPLSASGDGESTALEGAALSMGLRQALPAIQRMGQTLGLDELTVRTTTADTGELMAGKQISPRVYIRYSYGLFNRIGGLLMQFRLNDRFSLETRSGDYRSMDLIYTVERD